MENTIRVSRNIAASAAFQRNKDLFLNHVTTTQQLLQRLLLYYRINLTRISYYALEKDGIGIKRVLF
jgi:hypothetical protein